MNHSGFVYPEPIAQSYRCTNFSLNGLGRLGHLHRDRVTMRFKEKSFLGFFVCDLAQLRLSHNRPTNRRVSKKAPRRI